MNNHGFKGAQIAMKKIVGISAVVIILLAAGAVAWLFMSGRLVWVGNGTGQPVAQAVCGTDIVNKYNDAMNLIGRDGSSTPSIDANGIKSLTTEIKSKSGYQNDATCQTLLFWIAIYNNDYPGAKAAYDTVKQLHDKGLFADSDIRGNQPIFTYPLAYFPISPDASKKPETTSAP